MCDSGEGRGTKLGIRVYDYFWNLSVLGYSLLPLASFSPSLPPSIDKTIPLWSDMYNVWVVKYVAKFSVH